jgi:hypothetical protein
MLRQLSASYLRLFLRLCARRRSDEMDASLSIPWSRGVRSGIVGGTTSITGSAGGSVFTVEGQFPATRGGVSWPTVASGSADIITEIKERINDTSGPTCVMLNTCVKTPRSNSSIKILN